MRGPRPRSPGLEKRRVGEALSLLLLLMEEEACEDLLLQYLDGVRSLVATKRIVEQYKVVLVEAALLLARAKRNVLQELIFGEFGEKLGVPFLGFLPPLQAMLSQ